VLAAIGYFLRDVTWNILDLPDIGDKQKRSAKLSPARSMHASAQYFNSSKRLIPLNCATQYYAHYQYPGIARAT
jgi:hypothetical protein